MPTYAEDWDYVFPVMHSTEMGFSANFFVLSEKEGDEKGDNLRLLYNFKTAFVFTNFHLPLSG